MKKIIYSTLLITALLVSSCENRTGTPADQGDDNRYSDQEAIENILSRKSVRSFKDTPVEQEKIELMVRAGMAAPSAMDRRPWEIVVLNERDAMDELSGKLPYAQMLKEAPMAIIVCGNESTSGGWYIDCSAVTQNILLAAEALGLGAVWTGVYPGQERVDLVSEALNLPADVIPLALIPIGYPEGDHQPKDKYDPAKVHYNKW